MKIRFLIVVAILGCLLDRHPLFAQDSTLPKIEWTGMAALEEGQFVKCDYTAGPMSFRPWLTHEFARFGIKAMLNRHFRITVIPQFEIWNDTWDWTLLDPTTVPAAKNPLIQHVTTTLADAEATCSFGSRDAVAFSLSAGVIPYKYDEEAKNLGEYLFRTGEHPAYILNSFDQAYATMTGLRANAELLRNLSVDLFFTTETQVQPMNDWSLSFLAGYTVPGFLDVGAGIMLDRLFFAVPLLDKPVSGILNTYFTSAGVKDTFNWGGTKAMARLTFDPKGLLPSEIAGIFGKEDGKIYGEAAILGIKNITPYKHPFDFNTGGYDTTKLVIDTAHNFYSKLSQRIPVMFGFNLPTFKLFDYLSAEAEWYGDPFAPGMYTEEAFQYFLPQPNGTDPTISHWKYSFNFRKTMWGNISLIGQIARDHTRHDAFYIAYYDQDEIFQTKDEWGWWLKLQYNL